MYGIKTGEYDLYMSIGHVCSCTQALRYSKLQFYSYPYDWMGGPKFLDRIKLIHNNFKDFILKENLEFGYKVDVTKCDAYFDHKRGLQFNHDFKQGRDFDEMFEEVKEKYERRGKRLIEQIKSSKKILFVYMQMPNNEGVDLSDEVLLEGEKLLKEYFPWAQCDILNIICRHDVKPTVRHISDHIQQITFDYDARDKDTPWVVNFKTIDKLYRHFSISHKHLTKENIKEIRKYKLKLWLRGKMFQWI